MISPPQAWDEAIRFGAEHPHSRTSGAGPYQKLKVAMTNFNKVAMIHAWREHDRHTCGWIVGGGLQARRWNTCIQCGLLLFLSPPCHLIPGRKRAVFCGKHPGPACDATPLGEFLATHRNFIELGAVQNTKAKSRSAVARPAPSPAVMSWFPNPFKREPEKKPSSPTSHQQGSSSAAAAAADTAQEPDPPSVRADPVTSLGAPLGTSPGATSTYTPAPPPPTTGSGGASQLSCAAAATAGTAQQAKLHVVCTCGRI